MHRQWTRLVRMYRQTDRQTERVWKQNFVPSHKHGQEEIPVHNMRAARICGRQSQGQSNRRSRTFVEAYEVLEARNFTGNNPAKSCDGLRSKSSFTSWQELATPVQNQWQRSSAQSPCSLRVGMLTTYRAFHTKFPSYWKPDEKISYEGHVPAYFLKTWFQNPTLIGAPV